MEYLKTFKLFEYQKDDIYFIPYTDEVKSNVFWEDKSKDAAIIYIDRHEKLAQILGDRYDSKYIKWAFLSETSGEKYFKHYTKDGAIWLVFYKGELFSPYIPKDNNDLDRFKKPMIYDSDVNVISPEEFDKWMADNNIPATLEILKEFSDDFGKYHDIDNGTD